jgi:hypothetical protein
MQGAMVAQFAAHRDGGDVVDGRLAGSGLVLLTRSLRFVWIRDLYKPRPILLPPIPVLV